MGRRYGIVNDTDRSCFGLPTRGAMTECGDVHIY